MEKRFALLLFIIFCVKPLNTMATLDLASKKILTPAPKINLQGKQKNWAPAFAAVYETLFDNLRLPSASEETPINLRISEKTPEKPRYAIPGPKFVGVYVWDSAFIALIWADWDLPTAEDVLRAVFVNQQISGMLPHAVKGNEIKDTSQPPVMSWAVYEIYQKHHNLNFVKEVLPGLKKFHTWFNKERRHPNGLFFWQNAYESSVDNSARFTNRAQTEEGDTKALAAIDLSAFMVLDAEVLAKLSGLVGDTSSVKEYEKEALNLKAKINELLWDETDGLYYDKNIKTGSFHKFNTLASFVPLIAGIPNEKQAKALHRHLINKKEYNTLIPLPNVALNDPHFVLDCWRGPVWINMSYLALKGLQRYAYHKEYKDLRRRLIDGVYKVWQKEKEFYEFYDPTSFSSKKLTRKRGNEKAAAKQGPTPVAHFVGWTGLVNVLALEMSREKK